MTGLDVRLPIGLLFCVLGLLLVIFGLLSGPEIYQRSLGINMNLWWGAFLAAGGGIMLFIARKSITRKQPEKGS